MREISKILSYIFHPLLFPTYGTLLIITTNPNMFGYFGQKVHGLWLLTVFFLTFLFPVIWLLMMRGLQMIDNFELPDAKDRIVPFIATATFYLWTTWMFKPSPNMKLPPNQLVFLMMAGACMAIFLGFIINVFSKISLHSIAAGSMLGLMLPLVRISTLDLRLMLVAVILIAGVVGSARLLLNAHQPREVYLGYFVGFTGQFIGFTFVPILMQLTITSS